MLEHLDDVDWSTVQHAYGKALDVPSMIRALASEDDFEEALHDAYGNIFHQGTRYTATPKAIPFLIEIAAREPATQHTCQLLGLVMHCIAGYFSPIGGPRHASGPIFGKPPQPMSDYGETLEILEACEVAGEPAAPLCLRLLAHSDPEVRASACCLLAVLRRFADRYELVPKLRAHMARETNALVRALTAFALTHVLPMTETSVLEQIAQRDRDAIVRLIATMGCVRRGSTAPGLATQLIEWMSDDELAAAYQQLPFDTNGLAGDLGSLLTLLDRGSLRAALPLLLGKLKTAKDFDVVGILDAALAAVFGDDPVPAALTAEQRDVLETLAHNQAFWSIGNALSLLSDRKLPSWRVSMAQFLGITVDTDPIEAARVGARGSEAFGTDRALEEWSKVLELSRDDLEAHANIGMLLIQEEADDEALPHLRRALELAAIHPGVLDDDKLGSVWFCVGQIQLGRNDAESALASYREAQQLLKGSNRDGARRNCVAILHQLGRHDEALALELTVDASSAEERYQLGLSQVKAGKYAECIATITQVLAEVPDHGLAHYTIACAYALSGDRENAIASVRAAIEADPDLAPDIAADADFDSIRDDPRFGELVAD